MGKDELIKALKGRLAKLQPYNLVYVVLPVKYDLITLAEEIADHIGAEYMSVIGLLVERFGDVWDKLIEYEKQGKLSTITSTLQTLIRKRIQDSTKPVVLSDMEVLSIMPEVELTSLLYILSNMKLICVFIRGEFTGSSIRLLSAVPEYDVRQCTVFRLNST